MVEVSAKVLEHFRNPRNVGVIEGADGYGKVQNPICGDVTEIYIRVVEGVIVDASFTSLGCFATIASASALTEIVKGRRLNELLAYNNSVVEVIERLMDMVRAELGNLPKEKWHCPPASLEAFVRALLQYYVKKGDSDKAKLLEEILEIIKPYYMKGREKL